jgi:nucleoid-associated protein YgaU
MKNAISRHARFEVISKERTTTKFVTVVSATLLMVVGCGNEPEQPKSRLTDEAAQPAAVDQQSNGVIQEKSNRPNTAADPAQPVSTEPTSMEQLLSEIDERSESEDEYGASAEEAEPTTQSEPDQKHKTYTVQSGDSLAAIAASHYGDPAMYRAIYEENQAILANPNDLKIGQELRLP